MNHDMGVVLVNTRISLSKFARHDQLKSQNTHLPLIQWWKMMESCEQLGLSVVPEDKQ